MKGAFAHWNEEVDIAIEDRTSGDEQVVMFTCTLNE